MKTSATNLIILTHGWTGSSVFSALLGRAGYWLGSETVKKADYDTFENADLVGLNRRLLRELAPGLDHEHQFELKDVESIARAAQALDLSPYRAFVERCSSHGPWVWKDPRLTWTIRAWESAMDLERTSFLVLTREDLQAWISSNSRRHVQSWSFTRRYNRGITEANCRFIRQVGRPWLRLSFEDLLLEPERTLDSLNEAFGLALGLSDLQAVCREPLYRRSRGVRDFLEAGLVFLRNYSERDGRGLRDTGAGQTSSANSSL